MKARYLYTFDVTRREQIAANSVYEAEQKIQGDVHKCDHVETEPNICEDDSERDERP